LALPVLSFRRLLLFLDLDEDQTKNDTKVISTRPKIDRPKNGSSFTAARFSTPMKLDLWVADQAELERKD
jgi:hypothetical protein